MTRLKYLDPADGQYKLLPLGGGEDMVGINIKDLGAKGDGSTDDTAVIQAAINRTDNALIWFPLGIYKITAPLVVRSGIRLVGEQGARDSGETTPMSHIRQHTNSAEIIKGTDIRGLTIENLLLSTNDKAGHTADGISLIRSVNPATNYIRLTNVHINGAGRDGIAISNAIVSHFDGVVVVNAGRHGFNFYGVDNGAAGTSVLLNTCYANTCGWKETGSGYRIHKMTYCSLNACASDGDSGPAYLISDSQGISINGCGSEAPQGHAFFLVNTYGCSVSGCWVYQNRVAAIEIRTSYAAEVHGFTSMDPDVNYPSAADIITDASSTAVVSGLFGWGTKTYGAKTIVIGANAINGVDSMTPKASKFVMNTNTFDLSGTATTSLRINRTTNAYAQLEYAHSGSRLFALGTTNAASPDWRIWSDVGAKAVLTVKSDGSLATFSTPVVLGNVAAAPGTVSGSGVLYVEGGALKFRGSSGTVTTVAPA